MPMILLKPRTRVRLPSRIGFLRALAVVTMAIALGAGRQLWITALIDFGISPFTGEWFTIWALFATSALLALAWLLVALLPQTAAKLALLPRPDVDSRGLRAGLWIIAALSFVPLTSAVLDPHYGRILADRTWLRLDLLWWQALLLGASLTILRKDFRLAGALAAAVIAQAIVYRTLVYLPDISTYPLSLRYSEASQFYESSLFFSRLIYGRPTALPVLNPTLHVLLAVPYLIPHSPLWLHRAWQVILRTGLVAVIAWLLGRRMRIENGVVLAVFAGWAYLFLFQGPIYLHLTIPVIILLAAFDPYHTRRSWAAVLLASAWAGISRINWIAVPGMLAAALYLLEMPISSGGGSTLRYLRRPLSWLLAGTAVAFLSWRLYIAISGNDPSMFASSLTSDLFWYRLLPNSVNPMGVLPGALLVSAAPALMIAIALRGRLRRQWHTLRLAGLAAALVSLLAGGLIVSIKIGAGADLHSLDAYLILLLIVATELLWGRYASEEMEDGESPPAFPWQTVALAITVPVVFAVAQGGPFPERDHAAAEAAIAALRQKVEQVQQQGGEVLFIDQRQLLTFGELSGVSLVEPYEKEILVEMVMAHNNAYLASFRRALGNQRYALIVAGAVSGYSDGDQPWAEENNVWVSSVVRLLDCEYERLPIEGPRSGVYVPRAGHPRCENP